LVCNKRARNSMARSRRLLTFSLYSPLSPRVFISGRCGAAVAAYRRAKHRRYADDATWQRAAALRTSPLSDKQTVQNAAAALRVTPAVWIRIAPLRHFCAARAPLLAARHYVSKPLVCRLLPACWCLTTNAFLAALTPHCPSRGIPLRAFCPHQLLGQAA